MIKVISVGVGEPVVEDNNMVALKTWNAERSEKCSLKTHFFSTPEARTPLLSLP